VEKIRQFVILNDQETENEILMKLLLDGIWHSNHPDSPELRAEGARVSKQFFHSYVTADGSSGFKAERGRYHLSVSYACPFAHRTILVRKLKKLEDVISMSVLNPDWGSPNGWVFGSWADCTPDTANGSDYLHQVYTRALPDFTGKVTVPVLWDKQQETIVNNEAPEIIRMLNSEFDAFGDASVDFYPAQFRAEIDEINAFVSERVWGCTKLGLLVLKLTMTQRLIFCLMPWMWWKSD
jgi:putative glutathione S-transferase